MADRTFTEGEAYALVEDGVKRETAVATTRITELESENTALKNKADVLVTEKASETLRADTATQALVDFKDGIEQEKAREVLRTERVAAVADATTLLEMTDERAARIVAMDEEAFASYVTDLREIAAKSPVEDKGKCSHEGKCEMADGKCAKGAKDDKKAPPFGKAAELPRESAAFGGSIETAKAGGSVKGVIGASRALRTG